jgi:hypothetical protein
MSSELTISVAALVFSLISFALSFWQSVATFRAQIRPVVVVEYDTGKGWVLRNIGNGPALNILVAHWKQGAWRNPVRVQALPVQKQFRLTWLEAASPESIVAEYEDFRRRAYVTAFKARISRLSSGRVLPPWKESEIGVHWQQEGYHDPLNRP